MGALQKIGCAFIVPVARFYFCKYADEKRSSQTDAFEDDRAVIGLSRVDRHWRRHPLSRLLFKWNDKKGPPRSALCYFCKFIRVGGHYLGITLIPPAIVCCDRFLPEGAGAYFGALRLNKRIENFYGGAVVA